VLRWIHARETRLQDLQCVSVGDQQDVTTAMLPLQLRDKRGRPVQHSGRRLNVAVRVHRIGLVGCPDMRVVAGRRPFPVPEAPLAEAFGDDNLLRTELGAHDLCRLPRAAEVR